MALADAERLDLHLHTTRSDGGVTEEALLLLAGQRRLDVIAITDHDQAPSLPAGQHDVAGHPVWLLHGAEVSAIHAGREIHVLAFFPAEVPDAFRAFLAGRRVERRERYVATRAAFGLATGDDVEGKAWTRFHLAQELVEAGIVKNMSAAFAGPLKLGPFGVPVPEAIAGDRWQWRPRRVGAPEPRRRAELGSRLSALRHVGARVRAPRYRQVRARPAPRHRAQGRPRHHGRQRLARARRRSRRVQLPAARGAAVPRGARVRRSRRAQSAR